MRRTARDRALRGMHLIVFRSHGDTDSKVALRHRKQLLRAIGPSYYYRFVA